MLSWNGFRYPTSPFLYPETAGVPLGAIEELAYSQLCPTLW